MTLAPPGPGVCTPAHCAAGGDYTLLPPPFHKHLRLQERIENLPVQQLVPQLSVEALDVTVLPRASRLDEECLDSHLLEPFPYHRRGEPPRANSCRGDISPTIDLKLLPFASPTAFVACLIQGRHIFCRSNDLNVMTGRQDISAAGP